MRFTTAVVGLVGYSYGSVVAGNAIGCNETNMCTDGVDNLVAVGSPGMGFDSRNDLNADTAWIFASSFDPVVQSEWFTEDPREWSNQTAQNTKQMSLGQLTIDFLRVHTEYFLSDEAKGSKGVLECIVRAAKGIGGTRC